MNWLRWWLAKLLWRWQCSRWRYRVPWQHLLFGRYHGGRHIDWWPVLCPECGWRGPLRWCHHGYTACGADDVEPEDECPACGCNELDLEAGY